MAEWIYFIHPLRENFAATMTDEEKAVWSIHFDRFSVDAAKFIVFGRRERRPAAPVPSVPIPCRGHVPGTLGLCRHVRRPVSHAFVR